MNIEHINDVEKDEAQDAYGLNLKICLPIIPDIINLFRKLRTKVFKSCFVTNAYFKD